MGDNGTLTWWVDASYAVHDDMHGHTGGTLSAGTGSMYSTSNKQKLVSRSSTEAELIGVYDVMLLEQQRCPRPSDDGQVAVLVRKNRVLL